MTSQTITTPEQLDSLHVLLSNLKLPITVSWTKGKDRSEQQNALAFKWYGEIAAQMGDRDASQVRAHCKLYHGVKMLVTENDAFRDAWYRLIKDRFTLEEKLELMLEPHDYPVTRIMKVSQMTRYLDAIIAEFQPMGVTLTMPEDKL